MNDKEKKSNFVYKIDLAITFEPTTRAYQETKCSIDGYISREQMESIIDILKLPINKEKI